MAASPHVERRRHEERMYLAMAKSKREELRAMKSLPMAQRDRNAELHLSVEAARCASKARERASWIREEC